MFAGLQRDHHPHAEDGVDEQAAEIGAALAHLAGEAGQPLLEVGEGEEAGGDQHDADQEQPPVEPQHHRHAADEEQHVAEHREQGIRGSPLHVADVVVQAGHEVPQPEAGVEAWRQGLQVAEQRDADVVQHGRRQRDVAIAGEDVEHIAGNGRGDHQARNLDQRGHVPAQQRLVDQELGYVGLGQAEHRRKDADHEHQYEPPDIGAHERPQPRVRPPAGDRIGFVAALPHAATSRGSSR